MRPAVDMVPPGKGMVFFLAGQWTRERHFFLTQMKNNAFSVSIY